MADAISTYYLFNAEGNLIRKVKLSETFLRPVYQYTHAEIRNIQRENWEKEVDVFSKEE